ncbi:protein arginine N-methyltransferase, partial [Phakopsora pachyrhizi]
NFHNLRSSRLTFKIPRASVCHGLAGYFSVRLYGDVLIKTHPESKMSREMLSWFPIFFPLKEPVYCPKESKLELSIWRLTDN